MSDKQRADKAVDKDLRVSTQDFSKHIKPILERDLKGKIFSLEAQIKEGEYSYVTDMLDKISGIDAWYLNNNIGFRGIGSRCQRYNNMRGFTIRNSRDNDTRTELEKLRNAIKKNWLYPFWYVQGYFEKETGNPLGFALAKTKSIIKMIDQGYCYLNKTSDKQKGRGESEFYVIRWDEKAIIPKKLREEGFNESNVSSMKEEMPKDIKIYDT